MSLDAAAITELSRTIAEDYDDSEIVGVAATHGGSDRVELLVSVADADAVDGRRVRMLNLTRSQPAAFKRDLRDHLADTPK